VNELQKLLVQQFRLASAAETTAGDSLRRAPVVLPHWLSGGLATHHGTLEPIRKALVAAAAAEVASTSDGVVFSPTMHLCSGSNAAIPHQDVLRQRSAGALAGGVSAGAGAGAGAGAAAGAVASATESESAGMPCRFRVCVPRDDPAVSRSVRCDVFSLAVTAIQYSSSEAREWHSKFMRSVEDLQRGPQAGLLTDSVTEAAEAWRELEVSDVGRIADQLQEVFATSLLPPNRFTRRRPDYTGSSLSMPGVRRYVTRVLSPMLCAV
jgi:hypothetical protein